jgi:hypothetical protein
MAIAFTLSRLRFLNTKGSTNLVEPPSALTIPSPVPETWGDDEGESKRSDDLERFGLRGSMVGRVVLPPVDV